MKRLECFDSSVGALDQAEAKHDVLVVDREQAQQTRRSVFGLGLPTLPIFQRHGDPKGRDMEELQEISGKVASASSNNLGQWTLVLEDGSVWQQTDQDFMSITPHRGSTLVVRRAALGSFKMSIDGRSAVRCKRIR